MFLAPLFTHTAASRAKPAPAMTGAAAGDAENRNHERYPFLAPADGIFQGQRQLRFHVLPFDRAYRVRILDAEAVPARVPK
ncbi:MAG: hypothetical protein AAB268_01040 [Elusimicrobiota bacterium]